MAYRVYADGNLICSPNNEQTALDSPTLTLEANKAGTFSFTMLPDHPFYDRINLRTSLIDVYQDWELIFEGVPISESSDFYNRKTFECEGDLAFLNDTIQRLAVHEGMTPQTLLARYLATHNEQADANKQFQVGVVTVQGSNIYRYTNYQTTMTEIAEDLIENFGGYLRVRHEGGVRYLDYLAESPRASAQSIRIGKNLIDLSKNLNTLDICTVLIPLGAKTGTLDNIDTRLDIKTVNGGLDYLVGTGAAYYGNIWRTQTWDDVTVASNLKAKGQAYLDSVQWANLVIEATALDLGLTEEDVEQFRVLDTIRVVSEPHGLDRTFLLTKLQIDLNHPGDTQVTLGHDERLSLSKQTAQAAAKIEQAKTEIIATASENTRQILDAATDGAIQILYNENGVAYELRINNSQNPATATKWWRYNSAGWGYTADGGQTYTIAATMDGVFLANIISSGILQSREGNNPKFYLNLDTGELRGNFSSLSIQSDSVATQGYTNAAAAAAQSAAETTAAADATAKANAAQSAAEATAAADATSKANAAQSAAETTAAADATAKANAAEASAVSTAASNTSAAISNYDSGLDQTAVFNKLTNNQANQGIYIQNGQLYINANMIAAGILSGREINNGNGTFVVDENGAMTASNATITGGTISYRGENYVDINNDGIFGGNNDVLADDVPLFNLTVEDSEANIRYGKLELFDLQGGLNDYPTIEVKGSGEDDGAGHGEIRINAIQDSAGLIALVHKDTHVGQIFLMNGATQQQVVFVGANASTKRGLLYLNDEYGDRIATLGATAAGYGSLSLGDGNYTRCILNDGGVYWYDANGTIRCRINPTGGLYFFNSSGTLTKSYPAT